MFGAGTDVVDDVRSQVFGSRCDTVEGFLHWEDKRITVLVLM